MEGKLDRALLQGPKAIRPEEVMVLTGCRSLAAQYRWFQRHDIKPYVHGKYLRQDITNKIASLAIARR